MGNDPRLAGSCLFHFGQLTFAASGQFFNHCAGIIIINIDCNLFDRFQPGAVFIFAHQNLRPRNRQFKPLAPHIFDQHAHLQFAAPRNVKGLSSGGVTDLDGNIAFGFFEQTLADDTALYFFSVTPRKRAVIDAKGH